MRDLYSDNGRYVAVQQEDGNFVLYQKPGDKVIWSMWGFEGGRRDEPLPPSEDRPPTEDINTLFTQMESNVNPIGMSYWRNINNHHGRDYMYVVLSISDELQLYKVSKSSLDILEKRPLHIHHTGEGIYFSAVQSSMLYVTQGKELNLINVDTGERRTVWRSNYNLWQCHSDYNDRVHSASLKDDSWNIRYWGVNRSGEEKRYELAGVPDECQVDKSGEYLFIKEDQDNRILRLTTGNVKRVTDAQGALGHSDCGFGFAVGENDKSGAAGALDFIDFESGRHQNMFSTGIWNMGYVSCSNARSGSIRDQFCLVTTPEKLIKVKLDGSGRGTDICANLTQSQKYEHRPKANLCPLGEFAVWTAFVNDKVNAYIVRI